MASFGAKYPYFNPVAEEPEGKLPVYKDQEPVRVGRLVKADLTVNLASGKLFADDGLAESVEEFSSGSIAMETDDMEVLNEENPVYQDLKDVPEHWRPTAAALLEAGAVNGGTPAEVCATDLNLRKETLKAVVVAAAYHDAQAGKQ